MKKQALLLSALSMAATPALAQVHHAGTLDTVVVTATRSEQSQKNAPASITVITAEEIERSGATNLLEAVRQAPGISLQGHGVGGRKTFSIRGADSKHTLILIDGQRVTSTDDYVGHSDYQYGSVPIDQIERIEIIRGPMSALYGSEALGGVVNIITRKASDQWTTRVGTFGGLAQGPGGNEYRASASVSGRLTEHFDLVLGAEKAQRQSVPSRLDRRDSTMEGIDRHAVNVRFGFEPVEGQRLELSLSRVREDRPRDVLDTSLGPYHNRYELTRENHALTWQGKWDGLRADMSLVQTDFDVTTHRTNGVAPTVPQYMRDRIWNGNLYFGVGQMNMVTVGAEFRNEYLRHQEAEGGSDDVDHKALYVQDEIFLRDDLTLTLGGRYDHQGNFGSHFSPRAYAVWQVNSNLSIKGGLGSAFRAPTLKQGSSHYVATSTPITFYGNSNLKPETSRSQELGLIWEDERQSYSATLYENRVKNLITTSREPGMGPRERLYVNVNRARMRGLELATWHQLGRGFSVTASADILDARDRDTGSRLKGRPSLGSNVGAQWSGRKMGVGLDWQYIGRQHLDDDSSQLRRAPSYSLLHANFHYSITSNIKLYAGISNIGNVSLEKKSPLFNYEEMGRQYWLRLDAVF